MKWLSARWATFASASLLVGCSSHSDAPSAAATSVAGALAPPIVEVQRASLHATVNSTRFVAREHFLAGGEMQISGEPFAEAMGRDLRQYSRDNVPADLYFDSSPGALPWLDLPGFSTSVESYEYSKQPMNNVALESGAGTSLAYGPLVNPRGVSGAHATALLASMVQHFAAGSNAAARFVFPAGTYPVHTVRGGNQNPNGTGRAQDNPLGWPGIWPTLHAFRSFDPHVNPSHDVALACMISSDDDPGKRGALGSPDYECDATSLHLPNRAEQVEPILTPGADGFSAWKYGLWTLNYLQSMHDLKEAAVTKILSGTLAGVGIPGNMVRAFPSGFPWPGTYLGSSLIEGFQAQLLIEEIDNRAQDWLMHFATADGSTLTGFGRLTAALSYDYQLPLVWFPSEIAVKESNGGVFPKPTYALASANSNALDLLGLVLGYSEFYALTDTHNTDVGGSESARCFFDGNPFAGDNQLADGEASLHDRALAMLRVALIDLDRLHRDPASGVLVDDVTMKGNLPTRGRSASTTTVAYTVIALRTALRALSSQLELYSNNTPDSVVAGTPLDALPLHLSGDASTFSQRMSALLRSEAELLLTHLTDETGRAFAGWDVQAAAPVDSRDLLDAHTAAMRGLFAAYLATDDTRYRDRAVAVFRRLEATFYDVAARIYSVTPAPTDSVEYTPLRFALLQSALRDMYELVAARPGGASEQALLEQHVARLNKLVLNGWDDRNQDRIVEYPEECVNVAEGLPRGGLQMAERSLTGETGSLTARVNADAGERRVASADREHDCVPEIDDAHLPAALADSVTFRVTRN